VLTRCPLAHLAVQSAAVAATALALAACAPGPAAPARQHVAASAPARCEVRSNDFTVALQGFTKFLTLGKTTLPIQSRAGHPLLFQKQYICGEFTGLITNLALSGKYRKENNARARQLGYTLGKWPLVPLTGSIVRQQRHHILEIYEGIYQFTSGWPSAAFLKAEGSTETGIVGGLAQSLEPRNLPVHPAPGAVVTERSLGPQKASDERAIYVGLRINSFAVTLSFQGGRSLGWNDVISYWNAAKSRLTALETRS
jgi:hypothetical protein